MSDERYHVLVGISMHSDAMARLQAAASVRVALDYGPLLPEAIASLDGMIVYVPRFDEALLDRAERLRVVACHACEEPMLSALRARGIQVFVAPTMRDSVADMALALMFATARKVAQADAAIRRGEWGGPADLKVRYAGLDVFGKTLGILGLGRIGAILARRVRGFDMRLLYYDWERYPELERSLGIAYRPLDDLLAESDIVSVQLPITESTRGLLGVREFGLMKRHALLINTARGAILDQVALAAALAEGRIAGAGLDVLADEPIYPDDPLLKLDNVVLAPHLGGSTLECDSSMVEATLRVLTGTLSRRPVA